MNRVMVRIRVSVRIGVKFSFGGANLLETRGIVADPGQG